MFRNLSKILAQAGFLYFCLHPLAHSAEKPETPATQGAPVPRFAGTFQFLPFTWKVQQSDLHFTEETNTWTATDLQIALNGHDEDKPEETERPPVLLLSVGSFSSATPLKTGTGLSIPALEMEDLEIFSGPARKSPGIQIKRLTFSDIHLIDHAPKAASADTPFSNHVEFLRALASASFESVMIEGLQAGPSFSIGQMQGGKFSEGHLANFLINALQFKGSTVESGNHDEAVSRLNIQELEILGLDLTAYVKLFDHGTYFSAGSTRPWHTIFKEVRSGNIQFDGEQLNLSFSNSLLSNFKVRQFKENITAILDRATLGDPNDAQLQKDRRAIAEIFQQAFLIEQVNVSDLSVIGTSSTSPFEAATSQMTIDRMTAKQFDRLTLSAPAYSGPNGDGHADKLEIEDALLRKPYAPDGSDDATEKLVPTAGKITLSGAKGKLGEVTLASPKFQIEMSHYIGATPSHLSASLDHLLLVSAELPASQAKSLLSELEYDKLDLSFGLSMAWQEASSSLDLNTLSLSAQGIGTLSTAATITGISREAIGAPFERLPKELREGGLQSLNISYENENLFEHIVEELAERNETTPNEIKRLLSAHTAGVLQAIPSDKLRNSYTLAVVSFINDPKVFQLVSNSPRSVPFSEIRQAMNAPFSLPTVLNLNARHLLSQ